MARNPSNKAILEQLKHGIADFQIASSPVPSVSSHCPQNAHSAVFLTSITHKFFARIGPSLGIGSPAMKKLERYSVQKITGDGRCLFRALVKGMALNKGVALNPREERDNADELRMAVKEVICDNDKERLKYEEALVAITVEESLKRYCQRIGRPDFWGGESELLVSINSNAFLGWRTTCSSLFLYFTFFLRLPVDCGCSLSFRILFLKEWIVQRMKEQ
ncbi:Cysteine proteinases superfamily protein [Abeliophyllum distichum]|uniref:Ubiquitin thioesterase OTU n=1 Tax=Abeliophyllum distichum TaxID=126358 RepID=A0ABD1RAD7_9LAMI